MLWVLSAYGALFTSTTLARVDCVLLDNSTYVGTSSLLSLTRRALPLPAEWNHCAENGWEYYNRWKDTPQANQPLTWSVSDHCTTDVLTANKYGLPQSMRLLLMKLQIVPTGNDDWSLFTPINVIWPKGQTLESETASIFETAASARLEVFVAKDLKRRGLPEDNHFSQFIWYIWQTAVDRAQSDLTKCDIDYSGLKYYFADEIYEADTEAILDYVFEREVKDDLTYRPDDSFLRYNAFWALLGSRLGAGIQFMLIEHKGNMKGKGITSLSVKRYRHPPGPLGQQLSSYTMWATIG